MIPGRCSTTLKRGFRRVEQAAERDGALRGGLRADHGLHDGFRAAGALSSRTQAARGSSARDPVQSTARRRLRGSQRRRALGSRSTCCRLGSRAPGRASSKLSRPGRFGSAFVASFITIVREGVEVILILAMLLALVGKATSSASLRSPAKATGQSCGRCCVEQALARAMASCRSGRSGRSGGASGGGRWRASRRRCALNLLIVRRRARPAKRSKGP